MSWCAGPCLCGPQALGVCHFDPQTCGTTQEAAEEQVPWWVVLGMAGPALSPPHKAPPLALSEPCCHLCHGCRFESCLWGWGPAGAERAGLGGHPQQSCSR